MVGSSWNGRQFMATSMSGSEATAASSLFCPTKHQGQTASETTSTVISLLFASGTSYWRFHHVGN
jgi:hypothetical protein